jgi:hypothetical protein
MSILHFVKLFHVIYISSVDRGQLETCQPRFYGIGSTDLQSHSSFQLLLARPS